MNKDIKIIGYFVDRGGDKTNPCDVFVAIDEETNIHGDKSIYCPASGHGCASLTYMDEDCTEISLEEYKEASKHLYTPEVYLLTELAQSSE